MLAEKGKRGVVVYLNEDKLVLLTSEISRREAARLMKHERKVHRRLKFFPVQAAVAAQAIRKLNHSGIVSLLLVEDLNNPAWIPNRVVLSPPSWAN